MKTSAVLLASSALRSGRTARWTNGARRSCFFRSSSAFAAAPSVVDTTSSHTSSHRRRVAFGAVAVLFAGSSTTTAVAMCSNDDNAASASVTTAVKSIDDPLKTPPHNKLLPFPESSLRHDTYSGVTLDISKLLIDGSDESDNKLDAETFQEMLGKAIDIWKSENRRGIWIRCPTSHAHLIAPSTNYGFDFQHAEPGYCVLTKWLPTNSISRLPNGPTHQVGIGALVIHPRTGKMLAVQERNGPAAARKLVSQRPFFCSYVSSSSAFVVLTLLTAQWKMPTGLTDPGEDISSAAVRELKEETGLDCQFDRIICFRQAHGGLFNRSDIFFVCLCKLSPKYEQRLEEGGDIELLPQEEEILCADWIDMEDYAHQSVWKESPLYKEMNGAMLRVAQRGIEYSSDTNNNEGFVAKELPVGFRPGSNTIYVSSRL